jgi:lysophospholipase L1-like esterase
MPRYAGPYNPATAYQIGDVVPLNATTNYISLIAGNTGNPLASTPNAWAVFAVTQVFASFMKDPSGNLLSSATIYFQPCTSTGAAASFRWGASQDGQSTSTPVSALVDNGSFSVLLADTSLTNPVNMAYSVSLVDNVTGKHLLGPGYVIQPSGYAWNFDQFVPNLAPNVTVQNGPAGLSAYQVYAASVPAGSSPLSETAWLVSLQGPSGEVTTAAMNSAITAALSGSTGGSQPTTNGSVGAPAPDSAISGLIIMIPEPFAQDGNLDDVALTFTATSGGQVNIIIFEGSITNGVANVTVADVFTVTPASSGGRTTQTFLSGRDFAPRMVSEGQFIAYQTRDGFSAAYNQAGGGNGFYDMGYTSSMVVGNAFQLNQVTTNIHIELAATVHQPGTTGSPVATQQYVETAIAKIPATSSIRGLSANRTLLWDTQFASFPSNAVTVGGWSVTNGLVSPSSGQGYGTTFTLPQYYHFEKRVFRTVFQILSAGSVVGVGSLQSPNATWNGWGSLITVDSAANTLNIGNVWTGTGNPGVLQSVPLGFAIATGRNYLLTLTMNQRVITASLADSVTGITTSTSFGNNATESGNQLAGGAMQDWPTFVAIAGQFKVLESTILANAIHPSVLFLGDSITYGFELPIAQSWSAQAVAQIGSGAFRSARVSDTSYGILGKMMSEVQFLRPDTVMIMIGTNDGTGIVSTPQYESNITNSVALAKSYGCKVILALLPPAQQCPQATINTYNAFLSALPNVDGLVRFDLALTTANDGLTQNASLFNSDLIHPNAAGSVAMYNRLFVDVPWIFD